MCIYFNLLSSFPDSTPIITGAVGAGGALREGGNSVAVRDRLRLQAEVSQPLT